MADLPQEVNTEYPFLNDMAKAVVGEFFTPQKLESIERVIATGGAEIVKTVFAGIAVFLAEVLGPIAEGVASGQQKAEPAFRGVAAQVLSGMFNTSIGAGDLGAFGRGSSSRAGVAIADAVFQSIGKASGQLEPSDAQAKRFVADTMSRTVESWVSGFIFELITETMSVGFIKPERFGELANLMQNAMGVDRLMRQVLGPYVDMTAVTPFKWQLNKTYTPELLTPGEAAAQYYRGRWTIDQAREEMARQGWSADRIEAKLNAARKTLSASDVLYLYREGGYTLDFVRQYLKDLGYEDATIDTMIELDNVRRYRAIQEQQAATAAGGYIDGALDRADLLSVVGVTYPDDHERQLFLDLIDLKRAARRKRLSKGDIEDAVKRNILSPVDYRDWLEAEGYSLEAATTMELLLRGTISDVEDAKRQKAQVEEQKRLDAIAKAKADEEKRIALEELAQLTRTPIGDIKRAVVLGLVPIDRYQTALVALKYAPADIAFLVDMLQRDVDEQQQKEADRAAAETQATARGLSLGDLERAVLGGILSVAEYRAQLNAAQFEPAAIEVMVALLQQRIQAQADAQAKRDDAADRTIGHALSVGQAEALVRNGTWSLPQYRDWLVGLGYGDLDAGLIVSLLSSKMADEAEAERRRAEINAQPAADGVSLAQLEQAVLREISPISDYRNVLAKRGYSLADQQLLVALLQAKLDDAIAARARQTEVADETAQRRVSLGQIERAVKLGVVTIDAYEEYLADAGYPDADISLLVGNLVADLQAERDAEAAREAALAAKAQERASLAEIEADVLDGRASIDDYVRALRARAFAEADVTLLSEGLVERIAAENDARNLEQTVSDELAAKKVSLADFHAAVLGGLRTLTDYAEFLAAQGYGRADAQMLVTLLSRDVDDAADGAALRQRTQRP